MATTILRLYDDKKNGKDEYTIYVLYTHDGVSQKFSTKEKIKKADWDKEKERALASHGKGYKTKNDSILAFKDKIDRLARFAKMQEPPINPTPAYIKLKLTEEKQPKISKDFFNYYEDYIQNQILGTQTIKSKKTTIKHLKKFAELKKMRLTFESFDKDFYERFLNYLTGLKLQNNSIGKHIKNLKAILNYYFEKGINNKIDYKRFKKPTNETDRIIFDDEELNKLRKLYLPNKRLEKARDILLIGCYTGLRFSDIQNLKAANIFFYDREIRLTAIKTKDPIIIPILADAEPFLQKYIDEPNFLPKISNQRFNEYIKEIGEFAKFNTTTEKTTFIGAERTDNLKPKHQLITSHIMRRTFITRCFNNNMDSEQISQITGHKDYKSFRKYIKLSPKDIKASFFAAHEN